MFDALWISKAYAVIVNRKQLTEFVKAHTNLLGNTIIIVRGEARLVKWKSLGAGMYKVFTVDFN